MSKKKALLAKLIANPGSGRMTGNKLLEQVTRCLQDQGLKLDVVLVKPNEKAVPVARQAVKDGYDLVIAMGGDDTIWAVIRGIAGTRARLGIIPGGTENNVATSLGIPTDVEAACALIASCPARKLDVGLVKTRKGKKLTFFEVVTIGLASSLYPDVKKVPKGDLSGVKDAVLTVLHHPTTPKVTLKLDNGSNIRLKTMLVTVSNMPIMGAHFLVAPEASLDDGLLDIAVYPEFTKAELLAYFAQVKEEGRSENEKVQRFRARKMTIKSSPKMEVLADGTMLGKGTVKIRLLRRPVRVIAPKTGGAARAPEKEAAAELPAPVAPAPVEAQNGHQHRDSTTTGEHG